MSKARAGISLQGFEEQTAEKISLLEKTRKLILAHGWNTTSYQILNPGIKRWFSAANDAVIGFVAAVGVRVVAGAPICPPARLEEIAGEFESAAQRNNERVCYFAAESRLESV